MDKIKRYLILLSKGEKARERDGEKEWKRLLRSAALTLTSPFTFFVIPKASGNISQIYFRIYLC